MVGKRRALTTDDLLRMQEDGPARKRPRETEYLEDEDEGSDNDYTSSEDDPPAFKRKPDHNNKEDEGGSRSGSNEEGSNSDDGKESSAEEQLPAVQDLTSDDIEDFTSRMSVVPRTSVRVLQNPPTSQPKQATSFASFGISSVLLAALHKMSIKAPTEIQAACIPPLLQGRDCIGNAKTGSGKTMAFALPILQQLSVDPYGIFALVLTPTRELAFQISEQFAVLGAAFNLRTAVVVGGLDYISQANELKNQPHIVVATPGRIVDHMQRGCAEWDLSRVKFLVLDEADRLLTSSFAPELKFLFDAIPKERQTCLFTATWTPAIDSIAEAPSRPGKQKPFIHRMAEKIETVATLKQHYILVPSHVREAYLYYLLLNPPESTLHLRRAPSEPTKNLKKAEKALKNAIKASKKKTASDATDAVVQPPPTIIFCARPRTAAYLTALLKTLSIRSTALHSRLTQRERLTSLGLFRASVVPVLLSTDVGARGLDIEDVAMVVNWDLPSEPEEYTHRVGRTARAGKGGVAVSFVTERDEETMLKIEGRINTKLTEIELPESKVLEHLNAVSTAKRLANMELHDSNFGKREEIHRVKSEKRKADVAAVSS